MTLRQRLADALDPGPDRAALPDRIDLSPRLVFGLLVNDRRRLVIHEVAQADADGDVVTLNGLAESIAAAENDVDEAALDTQQRKRVYVSLYQSHLPRLEEAGAVAYDERSGDVRATALTHDLDAVAAAVIARAFPAADEPDTENARFVSPSRGLADLAHAGGGDE